LLLLVGPGLVRVLGMVLAQEPALGPVQVLGLVLAQVQVLAPGLELVSHKQPQCC